jgi:chemotaxis protein methyltransferase CheR
VNTFDFVRELVKTEAGIVIEPGKEYLLEARLAPVAQKQGLRSVDALVAEVRTAKSASLRRSVVDAMTTNETTFFRDVEPFLALQKRLLPRLIAARATRRALRIWCAASSTGQEPYSIAMIIHDHFPELLGWRLDVVGTDISSSAVERARSGRFTQLEVNRGLPARMLVKYFEKHGQEWHLADTIRKLVRFEEMNLNARWPSTLGTFDIVFIRNVMIYFDVEAKKRILSQLHDILAADGALFLGAAETTYNLDDRFARTDQDRSGCYRRI